VTSLDVRFPTAWAVMPCTGGSQQNALEQLGAALAEFGADVEDIGNQYLRALTDGLAEVGVSGVAALMLVNEDGTESVRAICAIGTMRAPEMSPSGLEGVLAEIAEAGPHPGLDRQTSRVTLAVGDTVRSSAMRRADELVDASGLAPFVAECRYVFAAGVEHVGILHFETDTVVYLDDLEPMFDAIAATVRLR